MKQDEKFIKQHFGKDNPFKVPQGYFDGLSAELMNKLPQKEPKTVKVTMTPRFTTKARPYFYAAALAGIAVFTASLFFNRSTQDDARTAYSGEQTIQQTSVYEQQVDDYLMLDNEDIYAYVAGYK
ncbi:MAG: hypothetical protein IJK49_11215 [Prevotella sp.]|nr:hypothetical protein [Prevotella sp.]